MSVSELRTCTIVIVVFEARIWIRWNKHTTQHKERGHYFYYSTTLALEGGKEGRVYIE